MALYWRQEKYSMRILYPHSILHLYTHIWIIVSMSGVERTILIWRISLYYKIRLFVLSTEFRPWTNTEYLYIQHSVLTVKRLYYYNIGLFMYKCSNSLLPEMFNTYYNKIEDTHSYNTRKSAANHLYLDFRSTSRGQKSCIYSSSVISWNCTGGNANSGGRYSIRVCDVYGTAAPSPAMTSKRKWPLECIVFNGTWRRWVTTWTIYKGKTYLYRPMY